MPILEKQKGIRYKLFCVDRKELKSLKSLRCMWVYMQTYRG